ncbi:TetR/AcrR family transcriptional regulator [Sinomonas atrocyanea]|uniref:TetR/AcrR family transcriptional regulator n=1 Tax=Sinomonas atrocyanea TaxID=37927 RepID=UPI0027836D33|nr:TetR/AcrR family transcriptional regulator [Sinomonas atrocyanea]MDQ0260613.1 AcrR family transcriptional regulator [Sinomonas atrocyanea]MDR6621382.1 AcrR family transcriptional regulator [Sinomonas atrocyanea]
MGRTQAFDRDTAVRAARAVFWQSGYEDASVPDLEQATGLSRSSIYNAFGSKRGLFDVAVQSYLDEVVRPRLRPLQGSHVEPEAIIGYLDGLREALAGAGSAPAANGCLLINAAGAPIAHDAEVARVIADYRDELRAAVGRGVRAHLPAATAVERDRLADAVTGLVVAAFALVRIAPDEASRSLLTARGLIGSFQTQAQ